MKTLIFFLKKKNIFKIFFYLILFNHLYNIIIYIVYNEIFDITYGQNVVEYHSASAIELIFIITKIAFIEEIIFRTIPMIIILLLSYYYPQKRDKTTIFIVIISCIIFGILHGNIYNILLQGVGGFILFSIFLRGYYKTIGKYSMIVAVIIATSQSIMFHILWNISFYILRWIS